MNGFCEIDDSGKISGHNWCYIYKFHIIERDKMSFAVRHFKILQTLGTYSDQARDTCQFFIPQRIVGRKKLLCGCVRSEQINASFVKLCSVGRCRDTIINRTSIHICMQVCMNYFLLHIYEFTLIARVIFLYHKNIFGMLKVAKEQSGCMMVSDHRHLQSIVRYLQNRNRYTGILPIF